MNPSRPGHTSVRASSPLAAFAGGIANFSISRTGAILASAALAVVVTDYASAANRIWNGSASALWSNNGNWNGNGVSNGDTLNFSGTTTLTNTNDALTSIGSITFTAGAGQFTLNGNTATLTGSVINSATTTQTLGLGLNMSATQTFDAAAGSLVMNGALGQTAASGLTKTGSFALSLNNNTNTYTGTTTVSAGTLFANGSTAATGSGAISVASGATFGGSGTIAPTGSNGINVSGVLAPGASVGTVGTLTFNMSGTTGTATLASGASLAFDLGLAGTSITSVGSSDLLVLAGASSGDFTFNGNSINFQGTGSNGFYKLFDTSSNNANTWTGLTFNGTTGVVSGGLSITNLASGKTGTLIVGTASNGGTTGDIYLQVVPESSSLLLAALGSGLLLRRRRIPS
ncbi:hypothetical protein [Luteolibacter soli]|uniref:PEP-CTERM protein-sorting domain-containing protein n=1 Tax=Luteolibacter soli TaxID=3135280 RepID=A0ABU9B1Q0_9BACT